MESQASKAADGGEDDEDERQTSNVCRVRSETVGVQSFVGWGREKTWRVEVSPDGEREHERTNEQRRTS